ncbi:hypothetical protein, partial [Dialister sp.]|uniref:hypothetical protein n=1 Tax=Dialister sp. TaxID=1955814 RepID=UPI0025F835DC
MDEAAIRPEGCGAVGMKVLHTYRDDTRALDRTAALQRICICGKWPLPQTGSSSIISYGAKEQDIQSVSLPWGNADQFAESDFIRIFMHCFVI